MLLYRDIFHPSIICNSKETCVKFRYFVAQLIRHLSPLMRVAYYVYRFFQPKYSVGVVGVVWQGERVLLVEHVFHPKLAWGLPGGWIGFNEDPSHAVQRELQEELGLTITQTELLLTEKTQYHHLDIAFECFPTNEIGNLSGELLAYKWYLISELPRIHAFHYRAILKSHAQREKTL